MAFEAEVARGIALLDERMPGWRAKVDLDQLNMGSGRLTKDGCGCIGVQLSETGDYYHGFCPQLGIDPFGVVAEQSGFVLPSHASGKYYELTKAWRHALTTEPVS